MACPVKNNGKFIELKILKIHCEKIEKYFNFLDLFLLIRIYEVFID